MRLRRAVLGVVLVFAVTACGIRPTEIVDAGRRPVPDVATAQLTIFLVKDGRLVEARRPGLPGHPSLGIVQLGVALTGEERRRGLTTAIPKGAQLFPILDDTSDRKVMEVTTDRWRPWSRLARAQLACTAEAVRGVEWTSFQPGLEDGGGNDLDDGPYLKLRCADFADLR